MDSVCYNSPSSLTRVEHLILLNPSNFRFDTNESEIISTSLEVLPVFKVDFTFSYFWLDGSFLFYMPLLPNF